MRSLAGMRVPTSPVDARRGGVRACLLTWLWLAVSIVAGCATATPPPVVAPAPPKPTYQQVVMSILHLEDRRVLSDSALTPPFPTDLVALLGAEYGRVRRRAALGIGRVGLASGVTPLAALLASDPEPEVRAMAAFALGLIGDAAAAPALMTALGDPDPRVQGRAAEGLGLIGHTAGAEVIAGMASAHVRAGALAALASDDETYPQAPPVEAVRLGVYALVRLSAFEPLRAVVLGVDGAPASDWWPLVYAVQRLANPAGAPALRVWLTRGGATTRAFAARGLGAIKDGESRVMLEALARDGRQTLGVRVQSVRALGAIADRRSSPVLTALLADTAPPNLRLEAMAALGALADPATAELIVDYLENAWAPMRSAAQAALAVVDAEMFMTVLSGLDTDPQWSARAALAVTLGRFPPDLAVARLEQLVRDPDPKVRAAALGAMTRLTLPTAGERLMAALTDPDPALRMSAANGLGALKTPGAAEALRRAFEAARADTTYTARAAVLAALVAVDPAGAASLLREALADPEWAIRVRAAALMAGLDGSTAVGPTRPAPAPKEPALDATAGLVSPAFSYHAYIQTSRGDIRIELAVLDAPRTVANFVALVRRGAFDGLAWHRVVPDFVVQTGDPRGDGEGGPGYTIRDEPNDRPYVRGTVGMALDWKDTGGSQFFITHSPQPQLDARYTVFGSVLTGMEVVDQLQPWDTILSVRVWDGAAWVGASRP